MNKDEEAIRSLIVEWHRAVSAGDVDAVLNLVSEDVVLIGPGKPPIIGRQTLEKGLRKLLKSHRIRSRVSVEEVEVSGDLAFCRTRLTIRTGSLSGKSTTQRSGHALSVFRKQPDNTWKLVRSSRSLIDENAI